MKKHKINTYNNKTQPRPTHTPLQNNKKQPNKLTPKSFSESEVFIAWPWWKYS